MNLTHVTVVIILVAEAFVATRWPVAGVDGVMFVLLLSVVVLAKGITNRLDMILLCSFNSSVDGNSSPGITRFSVYAGVVESYFSTRSEGYSLVLAIA